MGNRGTVLGTFKNILKEVEEICENYETFPLRQKRKGVV